MTACDELRATAAGVASLPEGDPERERYLAHARSCPGCLEALREGERLMRVLSTSALPEPSPQALRRAREPVLAALRPARTRWWLEAVAVIPGFLVPLLFARHLEAEGWAAALLVLVAAAALAGSAGALRAGALVTLAASAGFALAAGVPEVSFAAVPAHAGELECTVLELIAAALPLAAAAWLFQRDPRPGALAQAAAAGALAGQAALHLACPLRANPVHLWAFHVGGIAAAAIVGWAVERRLKSARS